MPMPPDNETLRVLLQALRESPANMPLIKHVADTLLGLGRVREAEEHYRRALEIQPHDGDAKLGLARVFYHQGKDSPALIIMEDLLEKGAPSAKALVLHARLLLRADRVQEALQQYERAVTIDPDAADADLADRLNVQVGGSEADRTETVEGRVRAPVWEQEVEALSSRIERSVITFDDVGGMEDLKEEVRLKIIYPLTNPDVYKAYGKAIGGGILMYGPPGCGKTYLAKATAGEIKTGFISVGINEILDMWIGNSERNLHAVFEEARRNKPCVLFFDEVDALGASRSDLRQSSSRQLINQFLAEMDSVQSSNEGVLILAATNAPWHLDSAFRRPGRFGRVLFVPPPDLEARIAILRAHCRNKPVEDIDHSHVGKKTEGFSGADLKAVIDLAIENKLRQAVKSGLPSPLTTKDLSAAAGALKPTTKDWFATARNYVIHANEAGMYDDVARYLRLK